MCIRDRCKDEEAKADWREMVELARTYPVDVRFIEIMPIGYGKQFSPIDHRTLKKEMKAWYPQMEEDHSSHGFGPAVYYHIPGFAGSIGFISAIHGKFCHQCNRVRLTAQGMLKTLSLIHIYIRWETSLSFSNSSFLVMLMPSLQLERSSRYLRSAKRAS